VTLSKLSFLSLCGLFLLRAAQRSLGLPPPLDERSSTLPQAAALMTGRRQRDVAFYHPPSNRPISATSTDTLEIKN
jgi:hypothetical protein